MSKFEIGDRVMINIDSEYYNENTACNPSYVLGTVTIVHERDSVVEVEWDNKKTNWYSDSDLDIKVKVKADFTDKQVINILIDQWKVEFSEEYNQLLVDSLEYRLKFKDEYIKIGCQAVNIEDSIKIAHKILEMYN